MTQKKNKTIKQQLKGYIMPFVIVALMISIFFFTNYVMETQTDERYEVLGIKTASAGTLFSSSVCVYETNRGDYVTNCAYDEGDVFYR